MKIKLQIKSVFGKVLFELTKENNTIKETLIEAIKSGVDLSGADLSYANLSGANANENTAMFFSQCPTEGAFIAWKKSK